MGGAEAAEGEAGKAEGDPRRAGEETRPTEERGRGAVKERGGREEGKGGGREEAGNDAGPEGEAVRWRQEGRRQEDRRRRHGERAGCAKGDDKDKGAAGGGEKDLAEHQDQAPRAGRDGRGRPEGEGQRVVGGDREA